jgi:hypothetical protein
MSIYELAKLIMKLPKTRKHFRIHVAGDFINQNELVLWDEVCKRVNREREMFFVAYTKQFALDYSAITSPNFKIVFSMWPELKDTAPKNYSRGWMLPKGQTVADLPIKQKAYPCAGSCSEKGCTRCWHLKPDEDIIFHEH